MMRPNNVDKSCGKPQNRLKYVRNNMKRQKEPTTRADSPPSPTKPSTSVTVSRRIVFSSPSKCVSLIHCTPTPVIPMRQPSGSLESPRGDE
ncbi:hypothetical protein DMENIID0001_162980 [Sergentomyia squamirostris]